MTLNNICRGHIFRIAVEVTMLALLLVGSVGATTLTVNASGGADYTRIQDAVNAANNGDTITIAAGTYNENVVVNKSVSLIGAGSEVTIVNASNPNDHVINVISNRVNISGLTLTGSAYRNAGIYLNGVVYANISNNNILSNWFGIWLHSSQNNNLTGNNISNNTRGIYFFENSDDNIFTDNMVNLNSEAGIGIDVTSRDIIYNNYFNNTKNIVIVAIPFSLTWNITKQASNNIVGGPYLGGNFWASPAGNGYSQKCEDSDSDGICDLPYQLDAIYNNIDYLPLSMNFKVDYNYSGILPPINEDGSSIFKLGSTVPVKFQLTNSSGSFVTNAVAKIYAAKISDGITGTEMEANSTSAATTSNLFRYDNTASQYIFNMGTKGLTVGTWKIRIEIDDGTSKYVIIGLK